MKATWSILKTAMNKTTNSTPLPDYFNVNNTRMSNKESIVNEFNHFFATIGSDISHNVPTAQAPFSDFLPRAHDRSMFLDPITTEDIISITSKLKPKTSRCHDGISTKLAKASIQAIAIPLTHIINQSLTTGVVPHDMKIARVIPIFKSGNQYLFNNLRNCYTNINMDFDRNIARFTQ